ncbi:MAG: FAD-binding domain-containing protein [Hyphomicrobiales bacterium]|nr:FAD-binding domain-containing protein [Hyphomicrobiales bacterium]
MTAPFPLTPTRDAGLARLAEFLPNAGRAYAARRNYDYGPDNRANISLLSPYLRRRLITEAETVDAVLGAHSFDAAEKFVQEVCWRTYWKGWLEARPQVWSAYGSSLRALNAELECDRAFRKRYDAAVAGATGVEPFDAFAHELVETGYLHNHARMWFASLWTHTLGLPWELGADFFFRHLIDADPASNTLSWRWVVGLQTAGKTYLARADNIEKYTAGRFRPRGLASDAPPPPAPNHPPAMAAPQPRPLTPGRVALILHEDDLHAESLRLEGVEVAAVVALDNADAYERRAEAASRFTELALQDGLARARRVFGCEGAMLDRRAVARWLTDRGLSAAVAAYAPVGPARDALDAVRAELGAGGGRLELVLRPWDAAFWPHATRGFFQLKDKIPQTLARLRAA